MKYILLFALFLITSCDNAKEVFLFLAKYVTKECAAGISGNLFAISESLPNNYTPTHENKIEMNLERGEYISRVNDGTYPRYTFINDGAGFGIADWCYYTRKAALYDKCKGKIADLNFQLQYLIQEFKTDFAKLFSYLKSSTNLKECSRRVFTEYFSGGRSEERINQIYEYSLASYNRYKSLVDN